MNNPLLIDSDLPMFSDILPEHVEPALDAVLEASRYKITELEALGDDVSWDSLVMPLQEMSDQLNNMWSPVSHLNSVMNSDELREAYTRGLDKLTAYYTELGQNKNIYWAYKKLAKSEEFLTLSRAQKTTIENELRDFKLAGVALEGDDKQHYSKIKQRLSELCTQFSNNVLDATQSWFKQIAESKKLKGIPDNNIALFAQAAEQKKLPGYVIGLDIPSYLAVMTYAEDQSLREEIYRAYSTRASEFGDEKLNNTALIKEILALRHTLAQLLGFDNYAELSLATKMAEECDEVEKFLLELTEKSKPNAEQEIKDLQLFSESLGNKENLNAWDIPYYSEKLKQKTFSISQEELRPYFPIDKVIEGLFSITKKLFGIDVVAAQTNVWHSNVKFFNIQKSGKTIASFYLDLFARDNKKGGAWMASCRARYLNQDQKLQLPVAFLVCNFTPALGGKPSLLTHTEVVTLFHEFGHGLHHMLTKMDVAAVSGINGVAWDAVELPSQFLENWCWEKQALELMSSHFETGQALPDELLNNLLAAKNFQSAIQMLRQVEFALFDFKLHENYNPQDTISVQEVLDAIRGQVAVLIPPTFNRFQNSFSHIFAGGYSAGYYSYKWAEVLSSDAFSKFEEEGIFNSATGLHFLENILERGGSEKAMALFEKFRGRKPEITPLLRHSGIC
jgi:oligopeptidase A